MKLTSVRVSVVSFVAYNLAPQTNTNSNHKSGCSILSCQLKFGHFSAIILYTPRLSTFFQQILQV